MPPLQKSTAQEMPSLLEDIMTVIPLSPPLPQEDGCKPKFNFGMSGRPKFIFGSIKP
jgi:hypothetical protein